MSTKNRNLYTGGFYHVFNRGVDKRITFYNEEDFERFLNYLIKCNSIFSYRRRNYLKDRPLVRLHAYCLMNNHFHLFVEQVEERGIERFMQKIGTGYAGYFNKKYQRSGRLFEMVYKSEHIEHDPQFLHISRYIHMNPLDLIQKGWKKRGVIDTDRAEKFLEEYPWSSYKIYLGEPSNIVDPFFILSQFESVNDYRSFIGRWFLKRS